MESISFSRGAALFIAPMVLASCGGGSSYPTPGAPPADYPALIKSAPPSVQGCTVDLESCNQNTGVGVVAKVQYGETGNIEIRFVTVNTVDSDTSNYNDGETSFDFTGGVGAGGEVLGFIPFSDNSGNIFGFVPVDWIDGNIGLQTDVSVIPTSGSATYSGGSYIEYGDFFGSYQSEFGTTTLDVNFAGEGTADLNIYLPVDAANITDFDQIQSMGMTIDGYTFTGDQVILLLDSTQVNEFGELTGVNTDGASAGIFFGPVDFNGNPEEFGAVAVVGGDSSYVYGLAAGGNPVPAD